MGISRVYQLPAAIVTAAGCILTMGCSRQFLSVFLDIPPAPVVVEAPPPQEVETPLLLTPVDTVRPPIEGTLDSDSAVALLPRDVAGNIDWMEALKAGVIKPRDFLPDSQPLVDLPNEFTFAFDFFFPGPVEQFDAFFPHSAHTKWVDCRQCHGRVFKYQDNPVTMAGILQGQWCGECHGKVAFPATTGCERCHASLPMPPNRAQPDLIGTITMQRFAAPDNAVPAPKVDVGGAGGDSSAVSGSTADSVDAQPQLAGLPGYLADALPPAQFPHWVHRIRYTCKACHVQIFEPQAGANRVTMTDISNGQACGVCHDGVTAFAAGFNECQRCHVDPNSSTSPAPSGPNPDEGTRSGGDHGSQ